MVINFFTEELDFKIKYKNVIRKWIYDVCYEESKKVGEVNFIFSSDEYIIKINKKYLNHNYYTDIITFNYNESDYINGDIYISIDRVKINSQEYLTDFQNELLRVIVHGILHLVGYDDKDEISSDVMTKKENLYLDLLSAKYLLKF